MKKLFYTAIASLIFINVCAQKTELRLGLNSGLFSFRGSHARPVSFIIYSETSENAYTNNPYGSKNGLCYGIAGSLKRVAKRKAVFGFELAYERLRSKISINEIFSHGGTSTTQYPADGKTNLNFGFINFEPFAGYRFVFKHVDLDLTAGLDLGYCLHAKEKGRATTNQTTIKTSVDRKTINMDVRPRLQISAGHERFGIHLGYSFGQMNYLSRLIGGTPEAYSRLIRFGINYQIGVK